DVAGILQRARRRYKQRAGRLSTRTIFRTTRTARAAERTSPSPPQSTSPPQHAITRRGCQVSSASIPDGQIPIEGCRFSQAFRAVTVDSGSTIRDALQKLTAWLERAGVRGPCWRIRLLSVAA